MLTSMAAARIAVKALLDGGVRHVVVAPGSRSAPLAYALAEAEAAGRVQLLVRIDERAAGFTALGLALSTGAPAAVVTTSGTAVGNLLPAVMEANHAAVPLIVLSADRPEALRGTGANQTTIQLDIFGEHVRFAVDVPAGDDPQRAVDTGIYAATGVLEGTPPGPVQLNLAFREPLVPLPDDALPSHSSRRPFHYDAGLQPMDLPPSRRELPERRTVVLAGHDAGPVAEAFARSHNLPLLAEPSSNARFGPNAVGPYRLLLDNFGPDSPMPIERVVVFGRPTLSRPVSALLAREDLETALYEPVPVAWYEPGRRRETPIETLSELAEFSGRGAAEWLDAWVMSGAAAQHAVERVLASASSAGAASGNTESGATRPGATEPGNTESGATTTGASAPGATKPGAAASGAVAPGPREPGAAASGATNPGATGSGAAALTGPAVGAAVWSHARGLLVLGSSNAIRDVDLAGAPAATPLATVFANRGLAGIDGTISTATGIALGGGRETTLLVGDVTFLHDAGGLLLGAEEPVPDLRIIVLNDAGGGIFGLLEHGKVEAGGNYGTAVERLFGTPHSVDIAALASAYGVGHQQVSTAAELDAVLESPLKGRSIVEVRADRSGLRALHTRITEAVAAAVGTVLLGS